MIKVPPLDYMLLYDAELKATGANIHRVVTAIALYKNGHRIAARRASEGTLTSDYIERVTAWECNLRLVIRSL